MDDLHAKFDEAIQRGLASAEFGSGDADAPADCSDEFLSLRYAEQHSDHLRYVHQFGHWMMWKGTRWRRDERQEALDLARKVARQASAEVVSRIGQGKLASVVASSKTDHAIERLSRTDHRLSSDADEWDVDQWALNTPDGTVNLKDGKLRPHDQADLITKVTAVGPGGDCPLWLEFLG